MAEKPFFKTSLIVVSAFCAVFAFGNKVKVLELDGELPQDQTPRFSVYSSDGENYDTVDVTRTAQVRIGLTAECRKGARKNKQPYRGELRIPGFEIIGDVSPPDDLIHSSDHIAAKVRFSGGKGQARALTSWCNDKLEQMLSDDSERSRYELMAAGFDVEAPYGINADYQLSCLSTGWGKDDQLRSDVLIDASIRCESSDIAANKIPSGEITIKPMENIPMVGEAVLRSNAEQFEGDCPVDFYFRSVISAARPGKVTYRFVDERGLASEVLELDFPAPGEQSTRIIRRHLGMLTGQSYTRVLDEGMELVNTHLFKDEEEDLADSPDEMALPDAGEESEIEPDNELIVDQSRESDDADDTDVVVATDPEAGAPDSETIDPEAEIEETVSLEDLEWDIQGSMTLEILSPDTLQSEPRRFYANCTK